MARGPKKHLKRLDAPKHWMLDKLSGSYVRPPRLVFVVERFFFSRVNEGTRWAFGSPLLSQATRPRAGPHKLRESLPLIIFLRNRLKYALTGREVRGA
jgi:small subunit ribosomal protein S4e